MPNKKSLLQIERAELIQADDDARDPSDPFKLVANVRLLVDTRVSDLKAKDSATLFTEGDRATASANVRAALDQLKDLLRDGYNFIKAIGSYAITDAERIGLFTAYGWTHGQIGDLKDARVESLANQAIVATPTITNPDHQYPPALLTLITEELATVNANQPLATGGSRQAAYAARDEALHLLKKIVDRVRFFYCSASDDEDQTPELARIGRQPRRDPGQASSGGGTLPGEPGLVTFDATNLELSVDEVPEGADSIRAYRMAAGGEVELAGESETTTVSVVEFSPLTPEDSYEFWLVGVSDAGEGPESNHIQFTAPLEVP